MRKIYKQIAVIGLAVVLLAGIAVYAATNYGSEDDPLITKSYLDEVVQPKLEAELKTQIDAAKKNIQSSIPGEFTELTLSAGQSVKCGLGSEFLLRSGSAKALGALADTTDGGSAANGVGLTANHMYLASEEGSGLTTSGSAVVLVSGSFSVE